MQSFKHPCVINPHQTAVAAPFGHDDGYEFALI